MPVSGVFAPSSIPRICEEQIPWLSKRARHVIVCQRDKMYPSKSKCVLGISASLATVGHSCDVSRNNRCLVVYALRHSDCRRRTLWTHACIITRRQRCTGRTTPSLGRGTPGPSSFRLRGAWTKGVRRVRQRQENAPFDRNRLECTLYTDSVHTRQH